MAPRLGPQRSPQHGAIGAALALTAGAYVAASGLAGGCVIPDRSFVQSDTMSNLPEPRDTTTAPPSEAESPPDAGAVQAAACEEYCDRVMTSCVGTTQIYTDLAECLAVCAAMPSGDPGATLGNSVACRLFWVNFPAFEANLCADVGPVSNGRCGDSCDAYCALREAACAEEDGLNPEFTQPGYCTMACGELRNLGAYSVLQTEGVAAYDNADTLQCRVGHLARVLANPMLAADECISSRIVPRNQLAPCQDGIDAISLQNDRETYCRLVQYACSGDLRVYSSIEECEAVSETFVRGEAEDTAANTLRCRRYHAYNAFEDPGTHCTHAGPTGDGTCAAPPETADGNCISYCRILERGCPNAYEDFAEAPGDDPLESCVDECKLLPDSGVGGFRTDPRYSVDVTLPAGTLKCRTLHAVRALTAADDSECEAAIGAEGSECETPEEIADPL